MEIPHHKPGYGPSSPLFPMITRLHVVLCIGQQAFLECLLCVRQGTGSWMGKDRGFDLRGLVGGGGGGEGAARTECHLTTFRCSLLSETSLGRSAVSHMGESRSFQATGSSLRTVTQEWPGVMSGEPSQETPRALLSHSRPSHPPFLPIHHVGSALHPQL